MSPNVPKFSLALIAIAEDHPSRELMVSHYEHRPFFSLLAHTISSYSPLMLCLYWYLCILLFIRLSTDDSPRFVFADSTALRDSQWMAQSLKLPPDYMQPFLLPGERSVQPACGENPWMRFCPSAGHRFTLLGLRFPMTVCSVNRHSNRVLKQTSANMASPRQAQPNLEDGVVTVPLNLDRLRCAVLALCDLLTYAFFYLNSIQPLAQWTSGHRLPEPSNCHWVLW